MDLEAIRNEATAKNVMVAGDLILTAAVVAAAVAADDSGGLFAKSLPRWFSQPI